MNCTKSQNWLSWSLGSAIFLIALVITCFFNIRSSAPLRVPVPSVQAPTVPIRPAGGKTLADAAARLELAGAVGSSSRDLALDILPDVYDATEWHNVAPVSRMTGKAQNGWVAKDMFTALAYEASPGSYDGGIKDNAHQLSIFPEDGVLNAQMNIVGDAIVDYQYDAVDSPFIVMNVVFDLPSNHHKYMKMVGRPGSQGGIIIDPLNAPELLAQVITSTYMHIYVPVVGRAEPEEMLFYDEPFKALLAPADRAVADAATAKADRDSVQAEH